MNIIKKGVLVSIITLTQILVNPIAMASEEEYTSTNAIQFSEAELAQILAPIALYPDSLLTHVVIASTYPLEVVEAYRWLEENSDLEASEAVELAEKEGWDPSIAALVAFPNVLKRLNEDLQWTQNLGNAFIESEERVLDTIQTLRLQAEQANSLAEMKNMKVTKQNQQIVIEPIRKEVVYVPYYDTRVVYGNWRWNLYPPVFWDFRPHISLRFPHNISARFHWNAGINISFNYYFSAFKWHSRHLIVTNHHKTRKYRSFSRIASSHGVKRWQHKSNHRRDVAYRSVHRNRNYARNTINHGAKRKTIVNKHRAKGFVNKLRNNSRDHSSSRNKKFTETKRSTKHNSPKGNKDYGKNMKQKSFRQKLANNNISTKRIHEANKNPRFDSGNRQSSRQKQYDGQKVLSKPLGNSHKGKSRHEGETRQTANTRGKNETRSFEKKGQRQRVNKPRQNRNVNRNKRER